MRQYAYFSSQPALFHPQPPLGTWELVRRHYSLARQVMDGHYTISGRVMGIEPNQRGVPPLPLDTPSWWIGEGSPPRSECGCGDYFPLGAFGTVW